MIYSLFTNEFLKAFCKPRLKFITLCNIIRSLKFTYAGSFIYMTYTGNFLFVLSEREIYFLEEIQMDMDSTS